MKNFKSKNGITLVALVITIIILIILAGITMSIVLGEDGLIAKAQKGASDYKKAAEEEQNILDSINAFLEGRTDTVSSGTGEEISTPTQPSTPPSTPTENTIAKEGTFNYIGNYADINGDGTIDGIIYIDLLDTEHLSGTWSEISNSTFSITTDVDASNVKDYVISATNQIDSRWSSTESKDVIKLATTQTGTKDRFYVMGLDDITDGTNDTLYWYKSAYDTGMSDCATIAPNSNTGRQNTAVIKAKWDAGGYGATDPEDLWGYLPTTPKAGANPTAAANDTLQYRWFIPSKEEWCAFGNNLNLTRTSVANYNIEGYYWSSSPYEEYHALFAYLAFGWMAYDDVNTDGYVRASATF